MAFDHKAFDLVVVVGRQGTSCFVVVAAGSCIEVAD